MRKYGPLRNLSCIRFEGKHKLAKFDAKAMNFHKNSSFTLVLKEQLRLCYRYMSNTGFQSRIVFNTVLYKASCIENYEQLQYNLPLISVIVIVLSLFKLTVRLMI